MDPIKITAVDSNGVPGKTLINRLPDECPLCHVRIKPTNLSYLWLPGNDWIQGLFRCTNSSCDQAFVATYYPGGGVHVLGHTAPWRYATHEFPKAITDVSSTFQEIYNQAMAAEAGSLDQMVGIGLRKALEFLVKDFAISEKPERADEIKEAFLGTVIKQYIDDIRVKTLAERATWLGNDETHYVRKWEANDITDLKTLVTLTVNAIHNAILAKEYLKKMPPATK